MQSIWRYKSREIERDREKKIGRKRESRKETETERKYRHKKIKPNDRI